MRFADIVKDFLYDKKHFITIYDNKVHLFQYKDILSVSEKMIEVSFTKFIITIVGSKLNIQKLSKEELLIEGTVSKLEKKYE